ncbi:RNA-binding protein [Mangrovibacillus cuniculi]|uniref:RNA-binding protein n=1 Tax=Mangrovibacillus cuniculi TaxID=2593652 RepID=A0A7S8CAC4_9BACI|nr:RNA-binding protein [Mangrovibacillus cuniculi]QPC46272.1 RNA-binding protein [Mangrovibacillus cuniculi]
MSSIYQHFRPEEAPFIDKVTSWIEQVEIQYAPKLTDFLDPRQMQIVQMMVGTKGEVKVDFHGGNETLERKRALLYPSYYQPVESDYQLQAFKITYPSKFVTIEHRQILGSLMNVGLKREKFGDILFHEEVWYCIVAHEVSDYVRLQLNAVGKTKVDVSECSLVEIPSFKEEWQEKKLTVSSLRLDVIVSNIYSTSRQKAAEYIQSGLVKVNWQQTDQVSFVCEAGDVISVRRKGRSTIVAIEGHTKKDKIKVTVGVKK